MHSTSVVLPKYFLESGKTERRERELEMTERERTKEIESGNFCEKRKGVFEERNRRIMVEARGGCC